MFFERCENKRKGRGVIKWDNNVRVSQYLPRQEVPLERRIGGRSSHQALERGLVRLESMKILVGWKKAF
jgi:hypothetical protein